MISAIHTPFSWMDYFDMSYTPNFQNIHFLQIRNILIFSGGSYLQQTVEVSL